LQFCYRHITLSMSKVVIKFHSKPSQQPVCEESPVEKTKEIDHPPSKISIKIIKTKNEEVSDDTKPTSHPAVKLIVTKKIDSQTYSILGTIQKPIHVAHDPVDLPDKLELESFMYQNEAYWIEKNSGYIFLPDDIQNNKIEPVGRLICKPSMQKITGYYCPLPNRKIDWYIKYEYDINT